MRYFTLILLCGIIASCNNNDGKFAKEIQSVDSLLTVNKELQAGIDSVDMDKIKEYAAIMKPKLKKLEKEYPDTSDRNFWVQEMGIYNTIYRGLSKWEGNAPSIHQSLKTSEHQLETLKNSLEDEKLSEEEATKYFRREYMEFAEAQAQYHRRHGGAVNALQAFPEVNTRMDSVIATLSQQ